MRPMSSISRLAALSAFATVLWLAGAASADKLLFSGEHGIRFAQNGVIKEVVAQGNGVATVNGSASGSGALNTVELTRAFAEINDTVIATNPGGLDEIRFEGVRINPLLAGPGGVPGVFAPILGAAQGMTLTQSTLPAEGTIRICNLSGCPGSVAVNLAQTDLGVAIGPGVGGTFTATGISGTMLVVKGAPWTVNTTSASYVTTMGMIGFLTGMGTVHGPLGMTGSTLDLTTLGMGGTLQLVTATKTTCLGCSGSNTPSGQISRLTLNFAPEPGVLILLGAGAIGVALLGRKRIQR